MTIYHYIGRTHRASTSSSGRQSESCAEAEEMNVLDTGEHAGAPSADPRLLSMT